MRSPPHLHTPGHQEPSAGASLPLLLVAALAGVGGSPWAAAWLVPSLTLALLTLTMGSYIGCTLGAVVTSGTWLLVIAAIARLSMHTLSGGMQRRVGIAQALVNSPELLLLDEPTTGLDPAERDRFHALLRQLSATTTVVLATHLMEDVHACCDSVLVLCTSRKAFLGPPQALQAAGGYAAVVAGSAHAGNTH
jgi:hypothetical protein